MKMWRRLFFRKKTKIIDIILISTINTLIDRLSNQVFEAYARDLATEEDSYIVYATWGAKENGHLSENQKSIYKKIDPEIRAIYDSLQLENLADSQSLAINSLIRGFVIFKILFMVALLRSKLGYTKSTQHETVQDVLHHIRIIGNA